MNPVNALALFSKCTPPTVKLSEHEDWERKARARIEIGEGVATIISLEDEDEYLYYYSPGLGSNPCELMYGEAMLWPNCIGALKAFCKHYCPWIDAEELWALLPELDTLLTA